MIKKLTGFEILFLCGIILFYFSFIPAELLINENRLIGGDTTAHSYYPHIVLEQCLPSFQFMCWSNDLLMGYVVLQHYFPFLFIVSALLGLIIPVNIAFKLIIFLAILSPPISLFITAKLLNFRGFVPILSAALTLLLMFSTYNKHMGFYILDNLSGQTSSTLAFSLFFLTLALFRNSVIRKEWGVLAGFVLGCAFLSHAMLIPILALATFTYIFIFWKLDKNLFRSLFGMVGIGFSLFSGWALPFLFDVNHSESPEIKKEIDLNFYSQFLDTRTIVVLILGVLGACLCSRSITPSLRVALSLLVASGSLVIISFFGNSIGSLAVFDRFYPAFLMSSCLSAGIFLNWFFQTYTKKLNLFPFLIIICLCFGLPFLESETAQSWAKWNFKGIENNPPYLAYKELADTLNKLPGQGRVAIFAMNNSKLTGGLGGPFIWETIGLLTKKPTLVTGTQGFYSLSFRAISEHYYAGIASGNPNKLQEFNRLFAISYIVKPRFLTVAAFSDKEKLVHSIQATNGEIWDIFDVTNKHDGFVPYVSISKWQPVLYTGSEKSISVMEKLYHNSSDLSQVFTPVIIDKSIKDHSFIKINSPDKITPVALKTDCEISEEKINGKEISFTTTCPGLPHQISISYNPGWISTQGENIYQIIPNHMLIIPETKNVHISFKLTTAARIGRIGVLSTFIILILCAINRLRFSNFLALIRFRKTPD